MVVVVDYAAGNLESVKKALAFLGHKVRFCQNYRDIRKADRLILPGVGDFSWGIENLQKKGLREEILRFLDKGRPFLGICLGLQMLFSYSEEAENVKGLGVFKGRIKKFPARKNLPVPHMGWNRVSFSRGFKIFKGIPNHSFFYFAHSYYAPLTPEMKPVAETEYGLKFCAGLNKGNVYAVQFHPEKSQKLGLKLLENFLKL